jgi:CO dehydrogenase/acetyl-CoA synthase epsilon subunit
MGWKIKGFLVDKAKELQAKDKEEAEVKLAKTIEESKKSKQEALQQQKTFVHNLTKELNGTGWEGSIQSEITLIL